MATHVETPPHTTGCAFDFSYRYMAADEQQFLMDRIAQLEDQGKVESLKERRLTNIIDETLKRVQEQNSVPPPTPIVNVTQTAPAAPCSAPG